MKTRLSPCVCLCFVLAFFALQTVSSRWLEGAEPTSLTPVVPFYKYTRTLVAATDYPDSPFLGFPAILEWKGDILVSYKRGRSHASDPGAALDFLRFNIATEKLQTPVTIAQVDNQIMQMGEWVRFANGDIANYIDAQQKANSNARVGLTVVRSNDGGKTFSAPEKVGVIDGVEYGYAFEAITEGNSTWMLAMTFSNLTGGKSVYQPRPAAGQVNVIRTDDNGKSWNFVANISRELGNLPINETSFMRYGDGYLVSPRSYDSRQWLAMMDKDFRLQQKVDLTATNAFITSYVGRPRLFTRDNQVYLLGRNYLGASHPTQGTGGNISVRESRGNRMRLSMFRLDPAKLEITKHIVLDNANDEQVGDGYYAMPYWQQRGEKTFFNLVTYKRVANRHPDIILLEFDWEEVR